jgi:hypothetical protein
MSRRIVVSAEASKLYSRKARWSAYKRHMCKWLMDTLQLELHGFEIAGQLEGPCVFTSTYRGAQITGWICTFDDKISACVTSIRFDDGDGWRPGGGPRKPNFANLEIISGSSIRGGGRYWELEQEYGDDVIGAPGTLNGKLSEPLQIEVVGDVVVRGAVVRNHAIEGMRNSEQLRASIAASFVRLLRLLTIIYARVSHSRLMREKFVVSRRTVELRMLARQVSMFRPLFQKWFDASKGCGFIAGSSTAPAMPSRAAAKPKHGRIFIRYRRSDAATLDDGHRSAGLSMLERIMLAEFVQRVRDVERVWIDTAGSDCERPEALYLLSVLATDVSEVLAASSRHAGYGSTIDEGNCYLPGSAAVREVGAGIGQPAHGPPMH